MDGSIDLTSSPESAAHKRRRVGGINGPFPSAGDVRHPHARGAETDDEAFARKLQEQFDEEDREYRRRVIRDIELASALANDMPVTHALTTDAPIGNRDTSNGKQTGETTSEGQTKTDDAGSAGGALASRALFLATERRKRPRADDSGEATANANAYANDNVKYRSSNDISGARSGYVNGDSRGEIINGAVLQSFGVASGAQPHTHSHTPSHTRLHSHSPLQSHPGARGSSDDSSLHVGRVNARDIARDQAASPHASSHSSSPTTATVQPHVTPTPTVAFRLTRCGGISANSNAGTVGLADILAMEPDLVMSVQFNYKVDLDWVMSCYSAAQRQCRMVLVHGERLPDVQRAVAQRALAYSDVQIVIPKLPDSFGTHHTKMMILFSRDHARVVVHTANLVPGDWGCKTQGVYLSPLFPRMASAATGSPYSTSSVGLRFGKDLLAYLHAYNDRRINEVAAMLLAFDFSAANVALVASVPGRHRSADLNKWGHRKLLSLLAQRRPDPNPQPSVLIGQFSSIGSLGNDENRWLCGEFFSSLNAGPAQSRLVTSDFRLVFPTVENVRQSLEGYAAGGSIPYSYANHEKQKYLNGRFCRWSASISGRSLAMPHIKTYGRFAVNGRSLTWFLLTSSNLSKAAWGSLEKNASQLFIRSYEMGVLFLPELWNPQTAVMFERSTPLETTLPPTTPLTVRFPVPYDIPTALYRQRGFIAGALVHRGCRVKSPL